MNTVEIPLKISGLAEIKAELRALKGELANATDPKEMAELAQRAGELKDQIADANEAANTFATGSKFEQVSNGLGGIKDSLMSLDFAEANQKAKVFSAALGKINPAEISQGFKSFTGMITTLGGAFIKLGATILMNPIFLIVALITAIVVGIGLLLKKFGILDAVFKAIMAPINAIIQALKDLGDWLGLTSFAEDEAHEEEMARVEAQKEARAELAAAREAQFNASQKQYDRQIALMDAEGKDTKALTKLKIEESIRYMTQKREELALEIQAQEQMVERIKWMGSVKKSEQYKQLQEQKKQQVELTEGILDAENQLKLNEINNAKKASDAAKENAKKASDAAKKRAEDAAKRAKEELENRRKLRDFELSQIKDDAQREEAITREKYARMLTDLKADKTKSNAEKLQFEKLYEQQLNVELNNQAEARRKKEEENTKKANETILQLRLALMPEGEAKEKAMQDDKYRKLREAAIADTTLTEEKRNEILALYDEQRAQEDKAKELEKQKAKDEFAKKFALEQMTQTDQELEALRVKYEEERKLAEGNAALLLELENKYTADRKKILDAQALAAIEEKTKERDAIIGLTNDIFGGVSNIAGMMIKDQKKLEKFNKASALIQIGIDTAKAISALVAASQANPFNAATAGTAGVAQFASGIIQIATNIAKAKQILTSGGTPSAGGGGGASGGGGGASASTAQVVPQAAQLFGQGNTGNVFSAGGTSTESSGITVTAVVSETAMTSTQNKINRINKNAEL
jgi:hypothetical protein